MPRFRTFPMRDASRPSAGRMAGAGVAALALLAALGLPGSAGAQVHTWAAGFTTGGTWISDLNPGATSDAVGVSPGLGAFFGIHADRWYGEAGRIGIRYQGAYQQPRFDWTPGERRIDAASVDVAGLFRLIAPDDAGAALPYVTAGLGGIWYDLGRGEPTFFGAADAYHDGRSRVLPLATFGVGVDVDFPWQWQRDPMRLRVEVADHMTFGSPLRQSSDESRYGPVHHVRVSVGLHSVLDLRR
jgi:hypothetical protein